MQRLPVGLLRHVVGARRGVQHEYRGGLGHGGVGLLAHFHLRIKREMETQSMSSSGAWWVVYILWQGLSHDLGDHVGGQVEVLRALGHRGSDQQSRDQIKA